MRLCLALIIGGCASALHAPALRGPSRAVGRACAPRLAKSTKLFSRNRLDFGSQDHAEHEFGLNGHMGGLAPQADTYVLVTVAYLLARRRALPFVDLIFAIGYPAYLAVANWCLFDCNLGFERPYKALLRTGRGAWFKRYLLTAAVIGVFLPFLVVLFAPSAIAAAASPHLFLLMVQLACEGLTSHKHFATVLRLAVPIGFNAYRLLAIQVWGASALAAVRASAGGGGVAAFWATSTLALALANGAFWTYNLFVFLLLRVAPPYLDGSISATPCSFAWKGALFPTRIVIEEDSGGSGAE